MNTLKGIGLGLVGIVTSAAAFATSPDEAKLGQPVMEELIVVAKSLETLNHERVDYTPAPIEIDYSMLTDKIEFTPEIRLQF